jgi:hypothetical protein
VRILFAIFVALNFTVPASALSLPLEGYFHPGRAMPVKWDVADSGSDIDLRDAGAIASRVHPAGNPWGVFPWIVVDASSPQNPHEGLDPLKPVEDSELIVVNTIVQDVDLTVPFPHRRMIEIRLDVDDLAGPAMAWESADVIALSSASLLKMPPEMRDSLFAEGIELVVLGDEKPQATLPWVRAGQWWIASARLPLPPAISPDAYLPTLGWTPGRTPEFRKRIAFLGVVFCLVILGVSLLRWRWTAAMIVVVSILATVVFAAINHNQSPIFTQSGIVRITGDPMLEDHWLCQVSHRRTPFTLALGGEVHPVFSARSQLAADSLVLECDENGRPISISGVLMPDDPLALMRRRIGELKMIGETTTTATSPLRLLVTDAVYPGLTTAGEIPGSGNPNSWVTIVVTQNKIGD